MGKIDSGGTISIAEVNSKNTAVGINKNMAKPVCSTLRKREKSCWA